MSSADASLSSMTLGGLALGGPSSHPLTSSYHDLLAKDPLAMATVFEHCAHFPPHGPYAHLSAVSLAAALQQRHQLVIPPTVLMEVFASYYRIDHLREWPSLYVAAELRLTDVDNL